MPKTCSPSCKNLVTVPPVCLVDSRFVSKLIYLSVGPYDAFWCLPGSPWIIGPFARRHKEEEEVQIDSSQPMLREIPVTGSEDALRLMIVFKHPQVGLENLLNAW